MFPDDVVPHLISLQPSMCVQLTVKAADLVTVEDYRCAASGLSAH